MQRWATFPPTGIVVVLRDLVEAELFVVVGADPFSGVDRAFFKRRVDVASAKSAVGRRRVFDMTLPAKPPIRILSPFRSSRAIDFLAEPAAHLAARIAREDRRSDVVLLVELLS